MDILLDQIHRVVLNPDYAPFLAILKGARNGAIYGAKIRLPHAFVMIFLFRSGSFREKLSLVLKATRHHARNLATFSVIYKSTCLALKHYGPYNGEEEGPLDSFLAGLLGGYIVFGREQSSLAQQIVIYVFARVVLSLASLSIEPGQHALSHLITPNMRTKITDTAWPVFASLSWAFVMHLFHWYPDSLQSSLRTSMVYIYSDSDHWDSLRTLLFHNK